MTGQDDDTKSSTTPPAGRGPVDRLVRPQCDEWVRYNTLTMCYETRDGTSVAAELVDSIQCFADVLRIAKIREEQREAVRSNV